MRAIGYDEHGEVVPGEAAAIRAARDTLLSDPGATLQAGVRAYNAVIAETGGPRVDARTLKRILTSPRIAGLKQDTRTGQLVAHHEAIVTVGELEQLTERLARGVGPSPRAQYPERSYMLTGGGALCDLCAHALGAHQVTSSSRAARLRAIDARIAKLTARLQVPVGARPGSAGVAGYRSQATYRKAQAQLAQRVGLRELAEKDPGSLTTGKPGYRCAKTEGGCGKVRVTRDLLDTHVGEEVLAAIASDARSGGRLAAVVRQARRDAEMARAFLAEAPARQRQLGEGFLTLPRPVFKAAAEALDAQMRQARALLEACDRLAGLDEGLEAVAWWNGATVEQRRALVMAIVAEIRVKPSASRGNGAAQRIGERVVIRFRSEQSSPQLSEPCAPPLFADAAQGAASSGGPGPLPTGAGSLFLEPKTGHG